MKMYTLDGTEVDLVKKIDEGYLAKHIYYGGYDEDDEEVESVCDEIMFYEKLFDKPQTEKYAKEVADLKDESEKLSAHISELRVIKSNEEYLLNRVSKYPIVQQLVDYITGYFSFVLYLRNLELYNKDQVWLSPYVAMAHTKVGGYALYRLQNEDYFSPQDDAKFLVFKTRSELDEFCKKELISRINKFDSYYNKSANIKELFSKIHYECTAKKDAEVIAIYEARLKILEAEERKELAEKLNKEITELSKKQEQLKKIQTEPIN